MTIKIHVRAAEEALGKEGESKMRFFFFPSRAQQRLVRVAGRLERRACWAVERALAVDTLDRADAVVRDITQVADGAAVPRVGREVEALNLAVNVVG